MRKFARSITLVAIVFAACMSQGAFGQSVLDPSDPIVNYNSSAPPSEPAWGTIGKWVRTPRLGWNTSAYKAYIYKGMAFRLKFPKTYNPTAADGKRYPMLIFFHGLGEAGPNTDNEFHLYHGAEFFGKSVDNGTFDGYVLMPQSTGSWGPSQFALLKELIDYMSANNKLDPFQVSINGLSAGGQAAWQMMFTWPGYVTSSLPMSWTSYFFGDTSWTNKLRFTPIWNFQGGQDGNPAPGTSTNVRDSFVNAGGNYRYTLYPTLGHGTWDSAWAEPDFWGFQLRAYASNPWPLFGRKDFCAGDPINTILGIAPGYDEYQWRRNGSLVQSGAENTLTITQLGTYDARVRRGTLWSDWSRVPVVIGIKGVTVSPTPTLNGLSTKVLPAPDGSTFVPLQVPDGYLTYSWRKVGTSTVLSTTRFLNAPGPGDYEVIVTERFGCSSVYSSPFTVVNASGPNKPDPAINLVVTTLSNTSIRLDWSDNPTPQFNETNFEVYYGTQPGGPYKLAGITGADIRTFTLNGLRSNTRYFFRVRAVNNTAAANPSLESNGTTQLDAKAPTAPGNLQITTSSRNSISLKWNASTDDVGVVRYEVYVNGQKTYATTQTGFTVSGLSSPNNYFFFVKAVDQAGNVSAPSNQVSGQALLRGLDYRYFNLGGPSVLPDFNTLTPDQTGLVANVGLAPATQSENFGFLWEGYINIPVAGQYQFNTYSDDGSRLYLGALNAQGSPYTYAPSPTMIVDNDGGHGAMNVYSNPVTLQAGTYPIAIAYFNGVGGGTIGINWKTPQTGGNFTAIPDSVFRDRPVINGTAPNRPSNLVATPVSYRQINLSWTRNSTNETAFEIWRSTSPIAGFTTIAQVPGGTTTYQDTSLTANTQYYYKVRAVNAYGESAFDKDGQGVDYAYYETAALTQLPDFNAMTPVKTGHVENLRLGMQDRADNFALKFTGTINIPTSGTYYFYLATDDGSRLFIDGEAASNMVVDHDGVHNNWERSGYRFLLAGPHRFTFLYFENGGPEVIDVKISGTNVPKQNIPDLYLGTGYTGAATLPAPAVPAQPTNLLASAVSKSSIHVSWNDNATNETKYEVYRSNGNTANYILYSTLPAGANSFDDNGLFPNAVFYYRVRAVGATNASAYSVGDSAKTWNTAPVILQLPANRTAHIGTTTTIPISATDSDGDVVNFTAQNLPAFASLTNNGNRKATLTLTAPPAGTYNGIRIIASDPNGGSDFTEFNLTVNNNNDPSMGAVSAISLNENDNLNIPLTASDADGNPISWTVNNAPNSFTLTPGAGGTTATLNLHPTYGSSGNYLMTLTAADGQGGYAISQVNVTVNDKNPNSKIYVRIQNDQTIGSPWNSVTSATSSNFTDESGTTTSVGLNFTNGFNTGNAGATTGNNSGIYPDAVLRNHFVFGTNWLPATGEAVITGLDPAARYNITVLGSSVWNIAPDNGSTNYTINGQTQSLAVQNNTQNAVNFYNLAPASNGTLTLSMAKAAGAPAGYLNALVIYPSFDDGTTPAAPISLVAQNSSEGVKLTWQNQAYNAASFKVFRSTSESGSYSQIGTADGPEATHYTDATVHGNLRYFYKVQAVSAGNALSAFSDVVSILVDNRKPVLSSISSVTLGNSQSLNVNVTATDDPGDVLTLSATGLPQFATFTDNGNGTGVISIQPLQSSVGVYRNITVTVKDNNGGSASTSFDITVQNKDLRSIYVNFTSGLNAEKPWNNYGNWPVAGNSYAAPRDDRDSVWTSLQLTMPDGFTGLFTTGARPGNGKEIYPEPVIRTGIYESSTAARRIVVSGLNTGLKYNFVFFNSHEDGSTGVTEYTINGVTVSLDAAYNINQTASINGVTTATGEVTIEVKKAAGSDNAYLNALVIQSYTDASLPFAPPAELRVTGATGKSISLQWQDQSGNETGFEIYRAESGGSYQLKATVGANVTRYTDTDPTLQSNHTYYYIVRGIKATAPVASNYSNVASGYTYAQSVFINVSNMNSAGSPWNNLAAQPELGHVWNNFQDENGAQSGIGLRETGVWAGMISSGVNTGNNSGIFPDNVMIESYGLFPGQKATVTLTGLNLTMKYDLTFFASVNGGGDVNVAYSVNGRTVLLSAAYNKSGTVTLYGVQPDENGEIVVTTAPGTPSSQYGLLGAIIVRGYTPSNGSIPAPASRMSVSPQMVQQNKESDVQDAFELRAYPNPFNRDLTLTVTATEPQELRILMYDMKGQLVHQQVYGTLNRGANVIRLSTPGTLVPGTYVIKAVLGNSRESRMIKVIRK